jgi:hypothetical protein
MKKYFTYGIFMLVFSTQQLFSQARMSERNAIGWYAFSGTFKFTDNLGLHTEYQWRRDNYVTDWQQSLLRTGLNYAVTDRVQLRIGYAWAETFAYGDIPINGFGKTFTEHRAYEMITIQDKIGRLGLSHRLMLEQRWVGRYSSAERSNEDEYLYSNRGRYMLRLQYPLKGDHIATGTPYLAAYNEVFIGFGEKVGENVFDQNRTGILLGYRFLPGLQAEGGYLSQIVQLGREVDNKNVFQYNSGFIVSLLASFDLTKKTEIK